MVLQVPNGFGCGLGAMQLILYAIYCKKGKSKNLAAADKPVDMELGKPQQEKQSRALNGNV